MKGQDMLIRGLLNEGSAAVAWAGSPGARAQYSAAMSVARQLGSAVTGTELSAMLWAAHNARPIADGRTRVVRELKFEPEGTDDEQLPVSFRLESWDTPQAKDGRVAGGWAGTAPPSRTVLTGGISRRKLEVLLADGISCLAWDGANG
jgi:hypothetical protein